jgi:hypothetical protein
MFKNLLFCILFCCSLIAYAQLDNNALKQSYTLTKTDTNRIKFVFESFSFLKNNEYFNNPVDGYTLFGEQISTAIKYQPTKNLLLQGGVFALREFGREKLTQVTPTFTVKYLHQDWNLLFGNLEGTTSHRLIEPLMNLERRITRPQELGWQVKQEKRNHFFDIWIDWLTAQKAGENTQEEVLGGVSYELGIMNYELKGERTQRVAKIQEGFDFAQPDSFPTSNIKHRTGRQTASSTSFIAQTTIYHRGGQIDINPTPLTTQINPALGFRWEKKYQNKIFHSLTTENYWLGFSEISNLHQSGFAKGHGFYFNLATKTKFGELMGSYWAGTKYISPIGGDLFQGVSRRWDALHQYPEPKRKILILRLMNNIKLTENAQIISRFEPYYDFGARAWNWSSSLFLSVKI